MRGTTHPGGMWKPASKKTAGGEPQEQAWRIHRTQVILWVCALLVFIVACVIIHFHPQPYAIDLATTQYVQGLLLPNWLHAVLVFPSTLNNPLPSMIALGVWVAWMLLMALIFQVSGKSPHTWLKAAVFLAFGCLASIPLQGGVEELVARPRPDPHHYPIHVYTPLVPFPTFPSGHTDYVVVYYGILLYLSFTKAVRDWRYRWWLLPLQLYAVFDILAIGYSRILEGDHWLTDVLGGYLEGFIHLFLFIFLYRWFTNYLAQRQERKQGILTR